MLIKLALPACVNKNNIVDYILFVVREYFDCHVTSLLESDWRTLYGARRLEPYTHLTRPLLALSVGGTGSRDYGWVCCISESLNCLSV